MIRKLPFSNVDHSVAVKYLDKADRFRIDAQKMLDLADEFSGNGVSVLCVHSAIAYADAIAILAAGKKSKSGDHQDAADFLAGVVPMHNAEGKAALKAFRTLLKRKDIVSYMDELIDTGEAADLLQKLETFARWSRKTFEDVRKRSSP